jgi:[acyl-carrier-protein] S-malonyltransferase
VYEAFATARDVYGESEETLGIPLRKICFDSTGDELRETRNAQLCLLVHGAAMWAVLREHDDAPASSAAGHTVGEYAAFHAAGALALPDVMKLVEVRGTSMAESGTTHPGTMAALLGEMNESVGDICARASAPGSVVVPANFNAPEQVVVSGNVDAVERAMELAKQAGARRAVRLNVSGAFHSPLMESALGNLSEALSNTEFRNPAVPVYANVSAQPCTDGDEARDLLGKQLVSPVRWVDVMRNLERDFPESLCLELGPGTVLAGLVKRCAPSLRTMPCGTAKDLDAIAKVLQ